ncbi:MAG TPA: hypothetical protein VI112_18325 [Bacteroidia bacterium]|jgi:hypothetical protein
MKRIFFFLLVVFNGDLRAQTLQTGMSPPLYFYPVFFKENNIRSISMEEHYRIFKSNKAMLSKAFSKLEILLDENGNARQMIDRSHRKSIDTLHIGPDTVVDGKIILKVEHDPSGKKITVDRSDGQALYRWDSLGRQVFAQRFKQEVQDPSHVYKEVWSYDDKDRPSTYDFYYCYIAKQNNIWDTITLVMINYSFQYNATGAMSAIDETYNSITNSITHSHYDVAYLKKGQVIIRDREEPTEKIPERYYAIIKLNKRDK